jgi:cysteine desulfurase
MSHHKQIFLDHASTTPVQPDVLGVMLPYFGNHFAIAGAGYELGQRSKTAVEIARYRVAQMVGARPGEIVFTGSGTEANNMAIVGAAYARQTSGKHIITSSIEHASVLNACRYLEQTGFRVTYLPVDENAVVDVSALNDAICDDTILITIMHANNEVGTIEPVKEIGIMAREKGITFHSDAVQSTGKIPVDVDGLHVDMLSIASHKIYGPKGVGALYIRPGTEIEPIFFGSDQERGLHPGSLNVPGIVGFGMACELANRDIESNMIKVKAMRKSLEEQILQRIPGAAVNAAGATRLPHISSISFEGVIADSLAANLDAKDIFVSCGSPFSSSKMQISHVLAAMHVGVLPAYGTLRFSLGWENRDKEIVKTVDRLEDSVARIREFSKSSESGEYWIFTFPDKQTAVSADKALDRKEFSCILTAKPSDIAEISSSHIALACASNDKKKIGVILDEHGIEITGVHRMQPQCETEKKKE